MASSFARFIRRSLMKHPVITNTTIYATFFSAAELSQQTFNKYYVTHKDIDYEAAAKIVFVGSAINAPTLYYWYKFLENKFTGRSVKMVLTKVACDQFIMEPVLVALFFILLALLEHHEDVFEELRQKYIQTILLNQCFWIPVSTINFFFIPPHLRVVYVAVASLIWINLLCFIKRM